jgi:hypothetical protein
MRMSAADIRAKKLQDSYIATYPHLVSFCSTNKPFTIETLYQAILMTYGWMPTEVVPKNRTVH